MRTGWLGADSGQDGRDDLVAKGGDSGDGADGVGRDVAAAGPAGFDDEVVGPEFA